MPRVSLIAITVIFIPECNDFPFCVSHSQKRMLFMIIFIIINNNEAEINQSANILLIEGTLCTGRPLYRAGTVVRADDKRRA